MSTTDWPDAPVLPTTDARGQAPLIVTLPVVPRTGPAPTPRGKRVLALDLGTHCGWAVLSPDGSVASGTQHFTLGRYEGGGMRFLRFKNWLDEIKTVSRTFDAVFFEEVRRHVSTDSSHLYGGLLAHLTAFCENFGIPYQGIPVGTIKSACTGRGNAPKTEDEKAKRNAKARAKGKKEYDGPTMMGAIAARGFNPVDDNEADALAVLLCALDAKMVGA